MEADAADQLFVLACNRLFDLHANGYVRPKARPVRRVHTPPVHRPMVVARPQRVAVSIF